jgi:bifunctional enzyme CysN/CysC
MDSTIQFFLKQNTNTTRTRIDKLRYKVDVNTLEKSEVDKLELNEIGRAVFTTAKTLFFDPYKKNKNTGAFILIHPVTNNTVAVGMIIDKMSADELPSRITELEKDKIDHGVGLISVGEYEQRYHQKGETIWITGLHGSGKNHLAFLLEKRLFQLGATVVLLDGSTIRSGLSKELDFSPSDRAEHLRRVAYIAKILNDQGIITICSFISPRKNIREQCARIIGTERFHLMHMNADLDYCKKNKPALYLKAEAGQLRHMPGIDEIYEKPENAALELEPKRNSRNAEKIIAYLAAKKIFPLH